MSEFDHAFRILEDAAAEFLRKFTEHCAREWLLTERDAQEDPKKLNEQYRAGWNAAMTDGLGGSLSQFLDEFRS